MDIAFQNSGGIRADISAGPITIADIHAISPFNNTLVVFEMTGEEVKKALEVDVERGWDRLQVSGIKYKHYPKEAKPQGQRVEYIEVGGEVLVQQGEVLLPDRIYTVTTNDYVFMDYNAANDDSYYIMTSTLNRLACRYVDNGAQAAVLTSTDYLVDLVGEWVHMVCMRKGTQVFYYDNGTLYGSGSNASLDDVDTSGGWSLTVGSYVTGAAGNGYPGTFDDMRFYDRALLLVPLPGILAIVIT